MIAWQGPSLHFPGAESPKQAGSRAGRQAGRQAGGQAGRRTGRQTGRQAVGRQAGRHIGTVCLQHYVFMQIKHTVLLLYNVPASIVEQ
jgi:hypothetical protein